jgi:hypothetical protein
VDRALAESGRNGFTTGSPSLSGGSYVATNSGTHVTVTVSKTSSSQQLQVTVAQDIPTYFLGAFGISTIHVSRTAVAGYLAPIPLGQPGARLGSTASELGTPSTNDYYFLRTEGWSTPKSEGDAYTPNPNGSSDVHNISGTNGNEVTDSTLPARGGYNYQVFLPRGGQIQVYNAVFGPERTHNNCENMKAPRTCNTHGTNYFMHEDDSFNWSAGAGEYSAMRYTVFSVSNLFLHSSDVKVSQMTVFPIDASNWSNGQYTDVVHGGTITQTFDSSGNPSNMAIYHSWVPITTYNGSNDKASSTATPVVQWNTGPLTGDLPPGTYRLRIDTLNNDGSLPPGATHAHKGFALRLLGPQGVQCDTGSDPCVVGAWDDMAIYTPVSGTSFTIPLFQMPPSYAGQTVDVDIYDPGDLNGNGGTASMSIIDASTGSTATGSGITIYDLGGSRVDPPSSPPGCSMGSPVTNPPCVVPSGSQASFPLLNSSGQAYFNGQWVRVEIPVAATYNPTGSPSSWYWQLRYSTTASVQAVDTITVTVSLRGAPAHLLSS